MDAIVGVWFTSFLGAGGFSVAGYVLGQRGVVLPFLKAPEPVVLPLPPPPPAPTSSPMPAPAESAPITDAPSERTRAAAVTIPPPAAPPAMRIDLVLADLEATRTELGEAEARAATSLERARAVEVVRTELERQIESLRTELRQEVVSRATAAARAEELGDRLASASEEAASLRHKVSQLDKERRQLREALQGRVRALTTSEWHRRRDLEEADEMRVKLRDVYEKIEKTSLPPGMSASMPPASLPPFSLPPLSPPQSSGRRDSDAALLAEVERLTSENRDLRLRTLAAPPTKKAPSRDSVPEVDLDLYRSLLEKVSDVAGVRAAIIADELGSLLVGAGELAEGLAAFGAYIRDASSRSDRLLPLDGIEEIEIRDRGGMLLSTRVVAHSPSELSLVMLGAAPASIVTAKRIAEETLRRR